MSKNKIPSNAPCSPSCNDTAKLLSRLWYRRTTHKNTLDSTISISNSGDITYSDILPTQHPVIISNERERERERRGREGEREGVKERVSE